MQIIHRNEHCASPYASMQQHIRKTIENNYPEELHKMPHGAIIPELAAAVAVQDQLHANSAKGESGFEMKQSTMPPTSFVGTLL